MTLISAYASVYAAAFALVFGALVWVQIAHVTRARWLVPFRRQLENIAALMPVMALLFVPLFLERARLFGWARAPTSVIVAPVATGGPSALVHAVVAFALFIVVAELLRGWSRANDAAPDPRRIARQRTLSAGALPPVSLAFTVFAFDFFMSVDAGFHSTIYAVVVFTGGAISALSLAAAIGARTLPPEVGDASFFALAKMLLAFVIFWAYVSFSQLIMIWIADLPSEVGWYIARTRGPWTAVAAIVGVANFALPFLVLLSRDFKESRARVAALGVFLVVAQIASSAWMIAPALRPDGPFPTLADLAVLVAFGVVLGGAGVLRARGASVMPTAEPELARALAFEDA